MAGHHATKERFTAGDPLEMKERFVVLAGRLGMMLILLAVGELPETKGRPPEVGGHRGMKGRPVEQEASKKWPVDRLLAQWRRSRSRMEVMANTTN